MHGNDEETFFVLNGSGLSWQDGETHEVRAGDTLVHAPRMAAHTLKAGPEGMDVLAYGPRTRLGGSYLPKIGIYWLWPTWTEAGTGQHPYDHGNTASYPYPGQPYPSRPPQGQNGGPAGDQRST